MAIDIFKIQPHQVSADMSGKTIMIYGDPKTGKTTESCKFPKPLLMAFEKGYTMIPGVMAQPINSWGDALLVKQQLLKNMKDYENGKIEEPFYKTVIIDTADIAWDMCEKYVASQADVTYVDELGYGKGPARATQLYGDFFNGLARAGYTMVIISHAKAIIEKVRGQEVTKTAPSLKDRPRQVLLGMVDIAAYAYSEEKPDGTMQVMLRMRDGDNVEAGSRTPYTSEVIPFTYDALMADIGQAMKKIGETTGKGTLDVPDNPYAPTEQVSYKELISKIGAHAKLMRQNECFDKYTAIVEQHLGKDAKVRDCTEKQADVLRVILDELDAEIEELGLIPAA